MSGSINILLAEDDENLGFVIKDNLTIAGYSITLCRNGEKALSSFEAGKYNLCILDVMMPKKDGFELAKEIRKQDSEIPIIFLTAKGMIEDKLEGFNVGGDDYLTKPFNMEELIYRINVFLKRSKQIIIEDDIYKIGGYTFDYKNLELSIKSSFSILTQKEADVLRLFCIHKGEVLKREFILTHIWGSDDYFLGRSMDVFISKLRKRLKEDTSVKITNFHGIGFKLEH